MRGISRWLVCTLMTVWLFGLWGFFSKIASGVFSPVQIQALSTLGILPVLLRLALMPQTRQGARRWRGAGWAFLAGVLVTAGNVAYFEALKTGGQASSVSCVTGLYPIVTVALSFAILRERLHPLQVGGMAISFAAIYLLNVSDDNVWQGSSWLQYALIPILLWGIGAFLQKLSSLHASGELSTAAFLAAFVPAGAGLYFLEPLTWNPSGRNWIMVILVGASFAYGNLLFLRAFSCGGKASIVTPIAALYPAVTSLLAVGLLHEELGGRAIAGIVVTCLALVLISVERKKDPT